MAEKKKTSAETSKKSAAKKAPVKKSTEKPTAKAAAPKRAAKSAAPKKAAKTPKAKLDKAPEVAPDAPVFVEARALARFIRMSPQKMRLVIDLIRGRDVGAALTTLKFTKKRAAKPIEKVLRSAIANAEQKDENLDVDKLYVSHAVINEGLRYKRMKPRMRGQADVFKRRTSHIEIKVTERGAGRRSVSA